MTLTPEEKAERARQRKIEKAREYSTGTYSRKYVAPVFQLMIRAEAAALPAEMVTAIVDGKAYWVGRSVGECVCVTCGQVGPWRGGKGRMQMHAGHFLGSRCNSILFDETCGGVNPQCSYCNRHLGGAPQEYRLWMLEVRGTEVVERLERLKNTKRQFTDEELVDMQISFAARLKAAEQAMQF